MKLTESAIDQRKIRLNEETGFLLISTRLAAEKHPAVSKIMRKNSNTSDIEKRRATIKTRINRIKKGASR